MITMDQVDYVVPESLAQAIELLGSDPQSQSIAGGNGLLTLLKRGEASVSTLVDLRKLDELRGVSLVDDGRLRVGASTTLTGLLRDPVLRAAHVPGVLSDAVATIGDVQARNRATIGGTIASADPGSDLSAALLAMDTTVRIVGSAGERVVPLADLLAVVAPLAQDELIVSVEIAPAEPGSAYAKFINRASLQAICGVAVTVALSAGGSVDRARVAVTGAMGFPQRLPEVESSLVDCAVPLSVGALDIEPFVSTFEASAEYRAHLTRILAERAFEVAVRRAREL